MRRHMGWSTLIGLLVILGLVGVAAIQQPRYGGTLRMVWEQDVTGFDPHWSPGLQVHYSVGNLFNSLVTIDEHLNDISELAESWGVQDNGNVYVFQLLKGVKFHDGSDIEAAAVAWNFERIMEKEEQAFLPVRTHIVDTHGYTDQLFGLCDLLGFAFMPRLKKLSGQRLFKPVGSPEERLFGSRAHPQLDPLFSGTVNLNLIADQWDALVRVAASLENRIVSPHVVAQRLVSSPASNRLALALTHLGRLVKTIYLLRYLNDPLLRQQVRTQLSRGEARHDLARSLFFADQGMFRSGDYYQIMNRASCLSWLSNAMLVYNTCCIARVLERARAQGQTFTSEAIAHVSLLMYRHVIFNGTYNFSLDGAGMAVE